MFEQLALEAGRAIMEIFVSGCSVTEKADKSPVTAADHAAEAIILGGLRAALPDVPCVAEEEIAGGHVPAELGDTFILVDPLDGTREFVEQRKDFTVNIALIRRGAPAIGVVYAPARGVLFGGRPGRAEKVHTGPDYAIMDRRAVNVRAPADPPAILASRSHSTPETDAFVARYPGAERVSIGSSLKFCMLACGEADIYPRFGRTMEWDTAAGDAVLRAAGGVTRTLNGDPLAYGKRNQAHDSDFANPHFVAWGRASAEA